MNADNSRRWQLLAIILVIGWLLWLLSPVLMPFAVAGMLAYLGDPLADRLEAWGLGRTLAATIVFVVILLLAVGAVLLLIPLISHQVDNFITNLPSYANWIRSTALPWLETKLNLDPAMFNPDRLMAAIREHMGSIGLLLGRISRSGMGVVMWLTNLVLIPVVAFYLLRDWDRLVAYVDSMLPRSIEPTAAHLARQSDRVLGAFVRGQLLVMVALGVFYGGALTIMGLSVGPLIGMVAGLLSFVPYLGFMVGFAATLIAVMVQFGDWTHLIIGVVIFIAGQMLEGYVLVPKLVGDKIGLHPVAVIFSVLAGGYLFGFLGILLALPAASVMLVLLQYLGERYQRSALYQTPAPVDPILREGDTKVDVTVRTAESSATTQTVIPRADDKDPPGAR